MKKIKEFIRKVVVVGSALMVTGSIMFVGYKTREFTIEPKTVFADREVDVTDKVLAEKIEALKDGVVDGIMKCESAGHKAEEGIVIMDTNDKLSYGPLQWQEHSFKYYYKKFNGKDLNGVEAKTKMLDKDEARALAKRVMFESGNKANDWFNCANKTGANQKIDIISQLSK